MAFQIIFIIINNYKNNFDQKFSEYFNEKILLTFSSEINLVLYADSFLHLKVVINY